MTSLMRDPDLRVSPYPDPFSREEFRLWLQDKRGHCMYCGARHTLVRHWEPCRNRSIELRDGSFQLRHRWVAEDIYNPRPVEKI